MTQVLRQSTAATVVLGPFVDFTDGATTEEVLTVSAAEVILLVNGIAAGAKSDSDALTHLNGGMYSCELNTTDTATVGKLDIIVNDTANDARPISRGFQVVEEAIYDALYVLGADGYSTAGAVQLATATQASIDAIESYAASLITSMAGVVAQVDTARTEPVLGNLDHTAKLAAKVDLILKILGNKRDQTATLQQIYNSDESNVDHKSIISSDGTTMTFGELKTGP